MQSEHTATAWRALVIIGLVNLLNFYDRLLVAVVSQPLRLEFHLTDTRYGLLTGPAFVLLYAVGNLGFGWLADRYPRKAVLAVAVTIWSAMTAVSGLAASFFMLALGRGGMGIGEGGSTPAGVSLLSDHFPPARRSLALSIFVSGGMAGLLLSFVLGSWIAVHFGWRTVFLVAGAPGLVLALAIALFVKEPGRGRFDVEAVAKLPYRQSLGLLRRNRAFIWICLGSAMGTFNSLGMLIWLPQFFIRSHGLSVQQVGFLFGPAAALGLTFGVLLGGVLGDRLSRRSLAHPLLICLGANVALIPLYLVVLWTPSLTLSLACIFLSMLLTAGYSGIVYAGIQNVAPAQARATATGVFALVVALIGQGILPYLVGMLSDALKAQAGDQALRLAITIAATTYSIITVALFTQAFGSAKRHFAALEAV